MPSLSTAELIKASEVVLLAPVVIASKQSSLDALAIVKQDLEDTDAINIAYFDGAVNSQAAYHAELGYISSSLPADYDTANVIPSAKKEPGNLHFPGSPIWVNYQPKLIDSINGNPVGVYAGLFEVKVIPVVRNHITAIISGIAGSTSTGGTYAAGTFTQTVSPLSGFSVGDIVRVDDGSTQNVSKITALVGADAADLEIISGTPPASGDLTSAFVNDSVTQGELVDLMNVESGIIGSQITELGSNDDEDPTRSAENIAADLDATSLKSTIDLWVATPDYTTPTLNSLDTDLTTRQTFNTTRVAQIGVSRGSVAQAADGTFTGTGIQHLLFTWLTARISQSAGTLSGQYKQDNSITFVTQQKENAEFLEAQYSNSITAVIAVSASLIVGVVDIPVTDASGFAASDVITLVDNSSPTNYETLTIDSILGLVITVTSAITKAYEPAQVARIFK